MKLYTHIEQIHNELADIGKTTTDLLDSAELSEFDQLHCHGTRPIDEAILIMGINSKSTVLEIGSGLGGPARQPRLELQPWSYNLIRMPLRNTLNQMWL